MSTTIEIDYTDALKLAIFSKLAYHNYVYDMTRKFYIGMAYQKSLDGMWWGLVKILEMVITGLRLGMK